MTRIFWSQEWLSNFWALRIDLFYLNDFLRSNKAQRASCGYLLYILRIEIYHNLILNLRAKPRTVHLFFIRTFCY